MNFSSLLNHANESKQTNGEWKVLSPANLDQHLGTCQYRYSDVDLAMKGAFATSVPTNFSERVQEVKKLREQLISKKESILSCAQAELGKTSEELAIEWKLTERFLESMLSENETKALEAQVANSDPRGLTVLLGSYVSPIFFTTQFVVSNFLAGNSMVVKPAEKSTLTVLKLLEIFREIESFKSVQALVGDREVGRRVATHEAVSTILFQGCFEVGMRVKQDALSQPSKEVLLYLGAKNPSIVFADAGAEVEALLMKDAFLAAGQNCRSISVIFVEQSRLASFVKTFHELSKAFKIGAPDTHAFMGPLIDGAMLDRYLKFIGISEREGAEVVMRGKPFVASGKGHFVTPSIALFETLSPDQLRKSVSLQTEILSPHVSIVGFKDEAELMSILPMMTHGKLASVWSEDVSRANRIAKQIATGEVLINQSVYDEDPWQTVQGRKRTGNHALLGRGLVSQLVYPKTIR